MYPEDRVLVGVIKARRDLEKALSEHWYRVPQGQAPKGIHAEVIAFFLSRAFKELNGGIHYYAERNGVELVRRRDLLPDESHHARADGLYYKLQLGALCRKDPPILNPTRRSFAFIYTTWDRFCAARVIADLYSEADHFVDRVFHALEDEGILAERIWEASRLSDDGGAQIRVVCVDGTVIASTAPRGEHVIPLEAVRSPRSMWRSVDAILEAIRQHGGPLMAPVPIED
ncbi:MAG: hypothetical protein EHM39_03535 [Chloroflexi bacterium]|nr:MAG: hypothetical protein EHM39_03535 [Chloroflexota bacterium]